MADVRLPPHDEMAANRAVLQTMPSIFIRKKTEISIQPCFL